GPNNAVLVLAGDVDVATARPLVEKWFGAIPAGPKQARLNVAIPTLATPKSDVLKDRVATVRLYRTWVVPGLDHKDMIPLSVGASVLGGLASSRLDNALVRQEQLAVAVSASYDPQAQLGWFRVTADVRPGVDPAQVGKRLDALVADFVKSGPTKDEVQRVVTRTAADQIAQLEQVGGFGGKATTLAEGALYLNDSDAYKKQLIALSQVKPDAVRKAMQGWLNRPVYALTVVPGDRDAYEEAAPAKANPEAVAQPAELQKGPAKQWPAVGAVADLSFPKVERATLSNGISVVYAQRTAVPMTQISLSLDAGNAADSRAKPGTQALMLSLLDEGAGGKSSRDIAEAQERLGATINAGSGMDRTSIGLSALSANLDPSLALLADIVQRPDFVPAEVERLRRQLLARIKSEQTNPQSIALRTLPPLLYGPNHPYGVSFTGSGNAASVSAVTRDELVAFHQAWVRPEKATIFVVSDLPLADVIAQLNRHFGAWQATGTAGQKPAASTQSGPSPRIVLVDRPGSPQSVILGGQLLPNRGTEDVETLLTANQAVGAGFLSRINMDLRETKGWSYGVSGSINRVVGQMPYLIFAPVQANRTGDSIAALRDNFRAFLSTQGVTAEERERIVSGNILELPGSFETSGDVLGALQRNALYGRPDTYYTTLASRYRAMTVPMLDSAIRSSVQPDGFLWVVVGDAKIVRPQLEKLGLPIELMSSSDGK
ncbi:MAG: insulinase family protein, partial [Alphaproteobacteria bacterium]|nr:insulinase family protein [Alphaproteobacteria bacterium]